MRAILYSTHQFERRAFEQANRTQAHELTYLSAPLEPTTAALAEGHQAVIPSLNDKLDTAMLQVLARHGVRLLALRSAGYNNADLAAARQLRLETVYVPAYTPHAVAEHVFALTLALLRHIPRAWQRARDEDFNVEGLVGTQLNGRTFGIVGLGKIGRVVAAIAQGFGCQVLACSPHADPHPTPFPLLPLEELLRKSHIVSLHAPLTAQTRHLLNAERLALLQPGAILINTSRGPLVDTVALIETLKGGQLGGVALDVYERESGVFYSDLSEQGLTDDVLARLLTFPRVIVTSHMGYLTWEALGEIAATTLASLTEFEQCKPLTHQLKPAEEPGAETRLAKSKSRHASCKRKNEELYDYENQRGAAIQCFLLASSVRPPCHPQAQRFSLAGSKQRSSGPTPASTNSWLSIGEILLAIPSVFRLGPRFRNRGPWVRRARPRQCQYIRWDNFGFVILPRKGGGLPIPPPPGRARHADPIEERRGRV